MIHLLMAIKRKDGLSREAFSRHWREVHAPLARRIPGLRGYVQNHSPSVLSRSQAYDGVVEVWMDDRDAIKVAFASHAYRNGAYVDEFTFVDIMHVLRLTARDEVLLDGDLPADSHPLLKRISFLKRKPGMSREAFSRYWKDVHGPLAVKLPGLRRYVQCHAVPAADGSDPMWDGAAALWFDSLADVHYALASPAYRDAAQPDAANFVDPDSVVTLLTEEYRIV